MAPQCLEAAFALYLYIVCVSGYVISPPNSKDHYMRLWYDSVGSYWNDSLRIGNGRLGGMIKGDPTSELIYMNEDSLWAGTKMSRLNQDAYSTLKDVQPLLALGDVINAEFLANLGLSGTPSSMREYQPAGDFQIVFQGQESASNYDRWLDLNDGMAGVYYEAGGITYQREYLASSPDNVICIHLSASAEGSLNFYIKFQRPSNQQNRFAEKAYSMEGDSIITAINSNQIAAVFGSTVKIKGGSKRQIGDQILVTGATEAIR